MEIAKNHLNTTKSPLIYKRAHIRDYLRRFWAKNALKMPLRDHFNRETNSNFFYTNMGIDTRI